MKKHKLARSLAALLATGALTLSGSTVALAIDSVSTVSLPEPLLEEVTQVWTSNGVEEATQEALIAKMESGETLDANLGFEPTSQVEADEGSHFKIVSTYPDGSISVTSLEKPQPSEGSGGVSPQAVEGCNTTWSPSVIQYRNCSANGWFTAVSLAFFVDYDAYATNTQIRNRWAPTVSCVAISCTTPQFEDIRWAGTNSAPAQVNLTTTWSSVIGSGTTRLAFYSRPGNHGYTN